MEPQAFLLIFSSSDINEAKDVLSKLESNIEDFDSVICLHHISPSFAPVPEQETELVDLRSQFEPLGTLWIRTDGTKSSTGKPPRRLLQEDDEDDPKKGLQIVMETLQTTAWRNMKRRSAPSSTRPSSSSSSSSSSEKEPLASQIPTKPKILTMEDFDRLYFSSGMGSGSGAALSRFESEMADLENEFQFGDFGKAGEEDEDDFESFGGALKSLDRDLKDFSSLQQQQPQDSSSSDLIPDDVKNLLNIDLTKEGADLSFEKVLQLQSLCQNLPPEQRLRLAASLSFSLSSALSFENDLDDDDDDLDDSFGDF